MEADFIIIGSGSAGSAMAYRLSEDGRNSVIVIEAGGSDAGPFIQMPGALSYPMNMSLYDWGFRTEPEAGLGGRRLACPRGKVIGGSSSINGMVYVRGHACDFDHWAEHGADGWSYADVLPYFKRLEARSGEGDSTFRGRDGSLTVSDIDWIHPLCEAFIEGAVQAGIPRNPDYNGAIQEGVAYAQRTINNGRRV